VNGDGRHQNSANRAVSLPHVARETLNNPSVADSFAKYRSALKSIQRLESVLSIEANAALAYWSAWSNLPIQYPRTDLRRVPNHWHVFGARVSPLTGSPRLAVNPPNAVLKYLYAILESEARLAAAELGLAPGLGVLHRDTPNRDSLAHDLLEPVRPLVDSYVFDWLNRGPLRKEWFFEQAKWELSVDGAICSAAFRDGRGMAQSSLALRGTSSQDFLAGQDQEVHAPAD